MNYLNELTFEKEIFTSLIFLSKSNAFNCILLVSDSGQLKSSIISRNFKGKYLDSLNNSNSQ